MDKKNVLIVDDDKLICRQLEKEVSRQFFNTYVVHNGKSALDLFYTTEIDIVLLDVKLPDMNGLDLLSFLIQKKPACEVIVVTGFGNQDIAIQSLRRGAIDYIEKPILGEELTAALGRAEERQDRNSKLFCKNKLLVIDDDREAADHLTKTLTKEGYDVFRAYSGREGLRIIEEHKIDVVLTDIRMPDMDGIGVLKEAKKRYQDIEGIMITGYREQELAIQALRAGAIDYIAKPIHLEELLFSIDKAIERINLNRNALYRNRELKISAEIITKMNEELEHRIIEKARELNRIQAQLFQTSKLATLGEMAAGLAHEINQPLGGIALVARHVRKLKEKNKLTDEELDSGLNDIETSVKRMTRVIQHIRTFARQDTLKFIRLDVNETITSALSLLGEQLRLHEISVNLFLDERLPTIIGEPYQLEQVWINLITNARDAVDTVREKNNYRKEITITTSYDGKQKMVTIVFCDNGIGMSEDILQKIFEPFFTTKEVGGATGLGLSISYGIIESHNGNISVSSEKEGKTCVTVLLPEGEKE
ncbi:MAG: response regulator [Spirochaetales bacterium]|nr:response regulator [Spirochaetales bacterium]